MEKVTLKALGMEGQGDEPSTVEEFDSIAGKAGAALLRARDYVRFHITLGDIRELFLHGQKGEPATDTKPAIEEVIGVEDATGIARNTKPVMKDGKPVVKDNEPVTEYDETEGKYFNRVVATLVTNGKFANEDDARASFQSLFDQVIRIVGFPAKASEHKASGPKKLAAKYKESAAVVITLGNVEKVNASQLSKINKSFTATNDTTKMFAGKREIGKGDAKKTVEFNVSDKDAETLGWLLKEYLEWQADQKREELIG